MEDMKKVNVPIEVPYDVRYSDFGCKNCFWASCECMNGSRYIPAMPIKKQVACKSYTYFDLTKEKKMGNSYFIIIHFDDGRDEIRQIVGFDNLGRWERMHTNLDYAVYSSQVRSTHVPEDFKDTYQYMEKMIIEKTEMMPFGNDPTHLNYLPAIKWYRQYMFDCDRGKPGLGESKQYVENVLTKYNIPWRKN